MNKLFSFVLLFLSLGLTAQINISDTLIYKVVYNLKYQISNIDSLDIRSESMILTIGNHFSVFQSNNRAISKKMMKEFEKTKIVDMRKLPKTNFKYQIVKDLKNNQLLFLNSFGVSKLYYSNNLKGFDWKLENEEKNIKGYKCKKAKTTFAGRDYIAWYAPDIPISDGPYKFNGLPGLILEIYDTNHHYNFTLESLEKVNEQYTLKYNEYIKVSKKQYDRHVEKIKEKPSLMVKTDRIVFSKEMLDKIDRRGRKKVAYENNPIELKENDE